MFEKNIIKYFFVLSFLIAISFPMVNTYYIFPSFSALLAKNAEDESVHIAEHLSLQVLGKDNNLKKLEEYMDYLEDSRKALNLEKIKLFQSNGKVIYSSDPKNIGDINDYSYFHEIVAKGRTYSKHVRKDHKSLEEQYVNSDVVETYVPIMKDGRFLGAFEIYFDITQQHILLQRAVFDSSIILFTLMLGFFIITGILLLIENRKVPGLKTDKDLKLYRSPFYLLSITIISLFLAEAIVMMIVSSFPSMSKPKEAVIDAALLVMVVSPALYLFLLQPLLLHISKRMQSEEHLQIACDELVVSIDQLEKEIIERKKMQEEIFQSHKEWADTFDIMTDAITIHDKDFNIIKSNKAAEKLLNLPFLKTNTTKCYKFYHGTDKPMTGCPSCDCMKTGIPAAFDLYEPNLKKHIEIRAMPRFDSRRNIIGTIHLVRDITKRKEMEEQLKTMSITDELTGLYNRRGFFTLIEQRLKVMKREKAIVSMLYVDIDNFKDINDTLGHNMGDSVLIDAANILKFTYRESDIIARLGGDEFVVFPVGKDQADVNRIIGRLQATIDIYNSEKERGYKLSMSIGIAAYDPENPYTLDDLLVQADRSMYENKGLKKNT